MGAADVFAQAKRRPARRQTGSVTATTKILPPSQSTPEALRRFEAFEMAWKALADNYFDPTFNKLDWAKIRTEYESRIRSAATDLAAHKLIEEMIDRLGKSHLVLIPPEVFKAIESAKVEAQFREAQRERHRNDKSDDNDENANEADEADDEDDLLAEYGIGVDLRLVDNSFVISRIDRGSSAERAGLKLGYVIEKINGVSLADLLHRITVSYARNTKFRRYLPIQIVAAFLNGQRDTDVSITYLDASNTSKEALIHREKIISTPVSFASGIPERRLKFESRTLEGDIGYIRFDQFAIPVIDRFCQAIAEFKGKKGLIIDLRGNTGGLIATMNALGGMLVESDLDLGTSIYRRGTEHLIATPKAKRFKGNIVFLVDELTVSAAEMFAASLQDAKRAFVVGERTAGEALPSITISLPTGAVLQYPIANYRTSSGRLLEGSGVTPDILVPLTRKALLSGADPQLAKALEMVSRDPVPFGKRSVEKPVPTAVAEVDDPPPPPPSISGQKYQLKPPPPRPAEPKPADRVKDPAAVKLIDDFLIAIGGAEKVQGIRTYELEGQAELFINGTKNDFTVGIFRDGPTKYSEILNSRSAGEIRELHNGKEHMIQTDFGLNHQMPFFNDIIDTDILSPIRSLADKAYFSSLKYQGIFPRLERKVHLIDGKTKDGMIVALAFDSTTGMLVNFTGAYYGISLDNYKKTGDMLLPFYIEREGIMSLSFDEIKVNEPVNPANFEKKEHCYDKDN